MSENKKTLWSKPLFRWFVYQIPVLVLWWMFASGIFGTNGYDAEKGGYDYPEYKIETIVKLPEFLIIPMWILILTVPTVWVWRKPLMHLGSFLNRVADDDSK